MRRTALVLHARLRLNRNLLVRALLVHNRLLLLLNRHLVDGRLLLVRHTGGLRVRIVLREVHALRLDLAGGGAGRGVGVGGAVLADVDRGDGEGGDEEEPVIPIVLAAVFLSDRNLSERNGGGSAAGQGFVGCRSKRT